MLLIHTIFSKKKIIKEAGDKTVINSRMHVTWIQLILYELQSLFDLDSFFLIVHINYHMCAKIDRMAE